MRYVLVEEALEIVKRAMLVVVDDERGFATEAEAGRFGGGGCIGRRRASRTGAVGHDYGGGEEKRGDKSDSNGGGVLVKVSHGRFGPSA